MSKFILVLLYIQFFATYILRIRVPLVTLSITLTIFLFICTYLVLNLKKLDKAVFVYILCLLLASINKAFIISANIIGYALYIKTKKIKGISFIKSLAGFCILLNAIFILVCIFMIVNDKNLIMTWGYKFDREIVLYCFKNPNSEALFLFLCLLSIWLFCKNKLLRIIIVTILACFSFELTYGRTFFFAAIGLIVADVLIKKSRIRLFLYILALIPIVVFVFSLGIGLAAENYDISFYDVGVNGRFSLYGRSINMMTPLNFIFGIPEERINFPFDGSFFVLFVTMGAFMSMFLLTQYIKYVKRIDSHYSNIVPALLGLILAGVTESVFVWFSIPSFFLITLLVSLRKTRLECRNNYCSCI